MSENSRPPQLPAMPQSYVFVSTIPGVVFLICQACGSLVPPEVILPDGTSAQRAHDAHHDWLIQHAVFR